MNVEEFAQSLPSDIFLHGVTYREGDASHWRTWISEDERGCIASFGSEKRQKQFLAGRAAARQLLAERLKSVPAEIPLCRAPDDAVNVDVPDWLVSIAHSGPHALAACAKCAVGVDLERIQPRDPGIVRFLFAPEDRRIVHQLPYDRSTALILCWALKEAVLKARRSGFRTSPKALGLNIDPAAEEATVHVEGGETWNVSFAQIGKYWATVAYPEA